MPLGLFCFKTDWNKINEDDSSISGCESTYQYQNLEPHISQTIQIILQLEKKKKQLKSKALLNDITELNLHKLTALEGQQVWLFAPKPFKDDYSEEIYQAIKQLKKVKKVLSNLGGWNVLISSKQEAKKLIQSGYKKNKTFLKFYFSTKNSEALQTESLGRKNSNFSEYNENIINKFETPRKQRKSTFEDQSSKKKVRYAEKQIEKKTNEEQNIIQKQEKEKPHGKTIDSDVQIYYRQGGRQRQYKQQTEGTSICGGRYIQTKNKKEEEKKTKIYKPKQQGLTLKSVDGSTIKDLDKKQNDLSKVDSQQLMINQPQISQLQETQQLSQESKEIDQIKGPDQLQEVDQDYDSEESLERMKKSIKRKNKKLNKKKDNGSPQADTMYASNPFSRLVKY